MIFWLLIALQNKNKYEYLPGSIELQQSRAMQAAKNHSIWKELNSKWAMSRKKVP